GGCWPGVPWGEGPCGAPGGGAKTVERAAEGRGGEPVADGGTGGAVAGRGGAPERPGADGEGEPTAASGGAAVSDRTLGRPVAAGAGVDGRGGAAPRGAPAGCWDTGVGIAGAAAPRCPASRGGLPAPSARRGRAVSQRRTTGPLGTEPRPPGEGLAAETETGASARAAAPTALA